MFENGTTKAGFLPRLRDLKAFLLLFSGQTVSQLGTAMTGFAVLIWVYTHKNAVMAVSLLAICNTVPYILVSIFGGALADRMNKKAVMLVCDGVAAVGTVVVLLLYSFGALEIWHLYIINAISSLMNAVQGPAAEVSVTLIVPKKHYVRVGGIQSVIGSGVRVLTPVLAAALLAFGGLRLVLTVDLITFAAAFLSLLFFVRIPKTKGEGQKRTPLSFRTDISQGFSYLKTQKGILNLFLFFGLFNLLGAMSMNMTSPMILARTGNNEQLLGIVSSMMALGGVLGGLLVSILKPAGNRTRVMFLGVAFAFLAAILLFGMGQNVWWWSVTALIGNMAMPFYFTYEGAILRENVPVDIQGRIYSIKGALSSGLIPIGLFFGALLADNIFEPLMKREGAIQDFLRPFVGSGSGAGIGLMFIICGLTGFIAALVLERNRAIRALNQRVEAKHTEMSA